MKKIFAVIMVCCLLLAFSGCRNNDEITDSSNEGSSIISVAQNNNESSRETLSTNSNDSSSVSTATQNNDNSKRETLREKYIREIDGFYEKESRENSEYYSTAGMVELASICSKKWKDISDTYYSKLISYDGIEQMNENYPNNEDFKNSIKNMKATWEAYYTAELSEYSNLLKAIYQGGSIGGPILANHEYNLQKEWALKLVGIYEQLYIE